MMPDQQGGRGQFQQGFSLIEVLIALVIVAVGLIGLLFTKTHHQQQAFAAHQRTLIGLHAQDLQNRLRMQACYLPQIETESEWSNFLPEIKADWVEAHSLLADWSLSLKAKPANGSYDELHKQAAEDGYWSFVLKFKPPDSASHISADISQRLLVAYQGSCP